MWLPESRCARAFAWRHGPLPVLLLIALSAGLACSSRPRGDGAARAERGAQAALPSSPAVTAAAPRGAAVATSSRSCAVCHPAIYAEHMQNTHGAAFVDEEARLATRDFRRANCVRCHTPRPVYETGLGMAPVERRHGLAEGNTCMSCHGKARYDYASFKGGAECRVAFDERVGTVASCASCHRVAGTPEQWSHAPAGKRAGRVCIDCHMPLVERPVAVGMPPREVRAHVFPASRSESQLHRAYRYDARIEGNEVVVSITNKGAGHNFPTASAQRVLQSLIVVHDAQGREVETSRVAFGHAYPAHDGLAMPAATQIPSGQTREHRVPIPVAAGSVECRLFFKRYHPIADGHPTLSRRLERRLLPFSGVTPSTHIAQPPAGGAGGRAVSPADARSLDKLAKFAHPAPGTSAVTIPAGDTAADIEQLMAILEFPVPGARRAAQARLIALGAHAVPALVEGLGHWSDDTRDQSADVLVRIGKPAIAAVRAALASDKVYPRYEARLVLTRMDLDPDARAEVRDAFEHDLTRPHPLDRRSAADALGRLGDPAAAPALRPLLADADWDVVAAAAQALALLDDRASVPAMKAALSRAPFIETRGDLAAALGALGSPAGIAVLLAGLDHEDDLVRRRFFEAFFPVTGLHESYDPDAPRSQRLQALARLQSVWAEKGASVLRRPKRVDPEANERAWKMVEALGGGTDTLPGGDDGVLLKRLVAMGSDATPALVRALATFPSGWAAKRALACEALGTIGDPAAAPYLVRVLRDPNLAVASWARWALSRAGDEAAVPALRTWSRRLAARQDTPSAGRPPAPLDILLARAAATRLRLGDEAARAELEELGGGPGFASSHLPSCAVVSLAETEPVPIPTSPVDAVAKAQSLRAKDFYEDAIRVLHGADVRFGPTAEVRLETAWNLIMIAEEDMTRDVDQATIDAEVAQARAAFEETLRMDPHVAGQDLLQARLLWYERAFGRARRMMGGLVADDPADVGAHRQYADFAFTVGDWGIAVREYGALARLQPKDGWPLLYETISKQWIERPAAELEDGYLTAARMLPEEPMPLERLAALYANNAGKNIALIEKVLAERPRAVMARVVLARLLRTRDAAGRARAERLLREALAISRRSGPAHLEFARLLAAAGRTRDAVLHELDALALADAAGVAAPSDDLDALLRAEATGDAIPAPLRLRAWRAVVARSPAGRYAHDAGVWYLDVGHEPATAARFLVAAVTAAPHEDAYRRDLARAHAAASGAG